MPGWLCRMSTVEFVKLYKSKKLILFVHETLLGIPRHVNCPLYIAHIVLLSPGIGRRIVSDPNIRPPNTMPPHNNLPGMYNTMRA